MEMSWAPEGQLFHFFRKKETGQLPITDYRMTRFLITLPEAVATVIHALEKWLVRNICKKNTLYKNYRFSKINCSRMYLKGNWIETRRKTS